MKKRMFSLILALALLCTLLPQVVLPASAEVYSGSCGDNLTWSLDTETGLLTITGSGAMADFYYPNYAPWCDYREAITAVSLPDGLTSIGGYAFNVCSALTGVTIPDSVTFIGGYAFSGCSALTGVTIPDSVTSIGKYAFSSCISLTSVNIGNSVTSIGVSAFWYCHSLTAIDVAVGNPNYTSVNGVLFNKAQTKLIQYPAGKPDTSYQIPASVTSIGSGAFNFCRSLSLIDVDTDNPNYVSVDGVLFNKAQTELIQYPAKKSDTSYQVPDSVTKIDDGAFSYCSSLTRVTIPDSVTSIGDRAFYGCDSMTEFVVDSGNSDYISVNGVLFRVSYSSDMVLIQYPTGKADVTYEIPNNVYGINAGAFYGCGSLSTVSIPDNVEWISDRAFYGCSALTSVTIPATVYSIGNRAFGYYGENEAQKVDGFTVYGYGGSYAQTYATENGFSFVSLGDAIVSGSCGAEGDRSNLTWKLNLKSGLLTIEGSGAMADFTPAPPWESYWQSVTAVSLPEGMTRIGEWGFGGLHISSVVIPNSVTSIGFNAFKGCYLNSVIIPAGVTTIELYAFGYNSNWEKIENFIIYGYPGTAAQTYAEEYGFTFIALEGFSDVTEGDYFFNPVTWAIHHDPQITAGIAPGQFGPNNDCTREQIVTFLWAANGKPEPEGTGSGFSDVAPGAWYYKPVMWAVENKITSGLPDGSFGVGQPCTRAQAMTFLWASKDKPTTSSMESPFSDVSSGDWFCKAILWAAENGITKGIGDGLFGVNNTCTRAQIITFLYKAYN